MNLYSVLATTVLLLHLLFILWVILGALLTRGRPLLRWLHLGSLGWGVVLEIVPWPCPLTPAENWFRSRAGIETYQGGFLLHYLDTLVYPDIPPTWLTLTTVAVCVGNLVIYAMRFRRRHVAGW
jgi:hypothetical protein